MKYIAIIDTDDYKDFEFFEDGNGKYLVTKDASAKNDEWIPLYFKECEQEPILDKIRAEIIELRSRQNVGVLECLDIINKYKAESDEQERVDDYRDRLDELEREEYYESKYGKEKE